MKHVKAMPCTLYAHRQCKVNLAFFTLPLFTMLKRKTVEAVENPTHP